MVRKYFTLLDPNTIETVPTTSSAFYPSQSNVDEWASALYSGSVNMSGSLQAINLGHWNSSSAEGWGE